MSDPGRPVDLKDSWRKAGVEIKVPPLEPRSAKNNKRKKKSKGEDTSAAAASAENEASRREEIAAQLAGKQSRQLQGNINSLTAENKYFESRLRRVQIELDSQRDNHFYSVSQDNRVMKDEMETLKGVQGKLEAANTKLAEHEKQLKRLPELEEERKQALKFASEAEEEVGKLKARVEELPAANEAAEVRFGKATDEGFQRAVDLTGILARVIKWEYFNGHHVAREGKIWLGDEEEEESPKKAEADAAAGNA